MSGSRYKVDATVRISVTTWIEDDGKTDLNDQAYDQVRDLCVSVQATFPGSGDEVEIADIDVHGVTKIGK